jgi:hypothetical protein
LKAAWANSFRDPIWKKNLLTKTDLVEWLKVEALSLNASITKKKGKKAKQNNLLFMSSCTIRNYVLMICDRRIRRAYICTVEK